MMDNKRAIELLGDLIGFEEELIDIKNEYNIPWYTEDINASDYDEALKIAIKTLEIESKSDNEYNCTRVKVRDKKGKEFDVLYDKSRQLLFFNCMTLDFALSTYGIEFIEESEDENGNR